jgi:hypothetical protein
VSQPRSSYRWIGSNLIIGISGSSGPRVRGPPWLGNAANLCEVPALADSSGLGNQQAHRLLGSAHAGSGSSAVVGPSAGRRPGAPCSP